MNRPVGFTRLGEEERARGYAFTVVTARFRGPDGTEFERDIIRHAGAVAVVPLHDDGSVTLVRQYRASLDHDLLELPAGVSDVPDEPDEETAARELAEEAGLAAASLEHLVTIHSAPGMSDERIALFLARDLTTVADDRQGEEEQAMTVERVALREAVGMIGDGRITDAKTVVGLLLIERHRA